MTAATKLENTTLAVLGAGKIGETLIRGLLEAGAIEPTRVRVTAAHLERTATLVRELGVIPAPSNRDAVRDAQLVLLCVKPQQVPAVVSEIADALEPRHLLVSVAASVGTRAIEKHLSTAVPVVRAMPNTPVLLKQGMTAIAPGSHATPEHLARARTIFDAVGRTVVVDEKHMDAITGLSASGPAFIYIVIESLAEGGVKVGLPRDLATELAAQTVLGSGAMVIGTGAHPALLKDQVTTPAGCTIDGILELEDGGLRVTLIKAVVRAAERGEPVHRELTVDQLARTLGRLLVLLGVTLLVLGTVLALRPRIPWLGGLPGDFVWQRKGWAIYLPLGTSLLVSVILGLVLRWIGRR